VALSFLYRLFRRVLEVVRVHSSDTAAKDAEILVLRLWVPKTSRGPLARDDASADLSDPNHGTSVLTR
jgi:hypothetical protein